jgi:hypothetical protein
LSGRGFGRDGPSRQRPPRRRPATTKTGDGGGRGRGGGTSHQAAAASTRSLLILDGRDGVPFSDNSVDTVLTNPPFGTKGDNGGIDVQFLRTATRLATRAVYSFHKRSTRPYILRTLTQEWGYADARVVAEMSFDIPHMYKFHSQTSRDVEVDLIRVGLAAAAVGQEKGPPPEDGAVSVS